MFVISFDHTAIVEVEAVRFAAHSILIALTLLVLLDDGSQYIGGACQGVRVCSSEEAMDLAWELWA